MAKAWKEIGHPALIERFVLRNGQAWDSGGRDEELGTPKECFANATHASLRTGWDYYEGYAMSKDISFPFHHAWLVYDQNQVIETTLKDPDNYEYIGVVIPAADLRRHLIEEQVYGVLDTGMINYRYIFKRDPELKKIAEEIMGRSF